MKTNNFRLILIAGFFVLVLGLGIALTLGTDDPDSQPSTSNTAPNSNPLPDSTDKITLEQVAQHNVQEDCWLAIRGKVYDVTTFFTHPGGEAILEGCGTDATFLFENRPSGSGTPHSSVAEEALQNFYIGDL